MCEVYALILMSSLYHKKPTEICQLNCKFRKGLISCHVTAHAHHSASHLATCTRCLEVVRYLTSVGS